MRINHKIIELTKAVTISLLFIFFMSIGLHYSSDGIAKRFMILLGGDLLNGGYIQLLTYTAFLWAFFEIRNLQSNIKTQNSAFKVNLLPTQEKHLILPAQVSDIHLKVGALHKGKKLLLFKMISKSCLKFRATKSIPEMIEIISIQTDINKDISESEQSNIRYLTWVIPSIGFVGTVLGISQSLMIANSGDMQLITATLGVAFDTTLVSLVLSIVIMWFYHELQKETDLLHARIKDHVVENLVNRIEME